MDFCLVKVKIETILQIIIKATLPCFLIKKSNFKRVTVGQIITEYTNYINYTLDQGEADQVGQESCRGQGSVLTI